MGGRNHRLWSGTLRPRASLLDLAARRWCDAHTVGAVGHGATRGTLAKDILVAGQIALAVLVLTAAGLVTKSLARLQQLDLGSPPIDHRGGARLARRQVQRVGRAIAMYDALVPAVQQMPGVVNASPLLTTPFSGTGGWDGMFTPEEQSADAERSNPWLNMEVASPGYFETVGVKLLRGRVFTDADRKGALPVLVVSEGTARTLWPGRDAVGKRLRLTTQTDLWTVIGVVADTRYREFRTPRATVYFPLQQIPFPYAPTMLIVRAHGDPASIVPELRRTIAKIDPDVVLAAATPMPRLLDRPLAQPRLNACCSRFGGVVIMLRPSSYACSPDVRQSSVSWAFASKSRGATEVRQLVVRVECCCRRRCGSRAVIAVVAKSASARCCSRSVHRPLNYAGVTALSPVIALARA